MFYKVTDSNGREHYVETSNPPLGPGEYAKACEVDENKMVWVSEAHAYPTSIYGMISSCGWMERDRMMEFKNTKKDQKILAQLKAAQDEGIRRSETWRQIYKSNK